MSPVTSWQDLVGGVQPFPDDTTSCCRPRPERPPATPEQIATLPEFMREGHRLHRLDDCADLESYHGDPDGDAPIEDADLVSSLLLDVPAGALGEDSWHRPVIDIDVPAALIPSSTEGHFHLYIDELVEWGDYLELLQSLAKCGIVEQGYVDAAERRGYSSLRLPWVKKEAVTDDAA